MLDRLLKTAIKIRFEYIAFILFITLFLIFYYLKFFSYIFLVASATIGAVIFIIFNKNISEEQEKKQFFDVSEDKSRRSILILSTLFFIFYGLSFLTLLQGFYTKTIWYYVFISLCAGCIAAEINFIRTKNQGTINLIKSFLLVLNITLSNQIVFPYGIGLPDLNYSLRLVSSIINNGYVPNIGGYQFFPNSHIFVATNILIAGSNLKMTYLYLGGLILSLGMLFVFIIGNKFVNLKFGLFAALIYSSLDYLIMYGSHPVHMTYIYFVSIVLFTVVLYRYERNDPRFAALYPVMIFSMVFMHHYSPMIILIVLSSMVFVELIQSVKDSDHDFKFPLLIQLFAVILFSQWMFYSNMMNSFISIIKAYSEAFAEGSKSVIAATAYDKLPITALFSNTFGSSILILLSTIGFLYFFKEKSFFKKAIMISTVTLAILLGIGVVLKQGFLLPDRMYPFLQLFGLVFLASGGILRIQDSINVRSRYLGQILIILIMISLTFFSASSTIAGFETSLFVDKNTAYSKLYESPHETYFNQWSESYVQNKTTLITTKFITKSDGIDLQNMNEKSLIIFDKFYLDTGFAIGTGGHIGQYNFIRLKEDNFHVLENYVKNYDNGMIKLFYT
ncbi:conserved membrane hypothetical protein [Candidatus Methanoperedens nitroreducens]|uniref:Glycosyltransferase RgtA/B/C/D-like domain-containing protein n=2 Tax=Candidatus Methanoperedens nitratireducens TaxID=1392998 RepID=A0A284VPG6_9EURY|nr:conserved membrane hypothetical protein [Candidatus Methanoperedens nitroreducens]